MEPHEDAGAEASEESRASDINRALPAVAEPQFAAPTSASPPKGSRSVDPAVGVLRALKRLEDLIDEETATLQARQPMDFNDFTRRKSRGLLELIRATRTARDLRGDPRVAARLTGLRARLEKNCAVLQMHFEAVREVSVIITNAIREAESDGTYSFVTGGQGK